MSGENDDECRGTDTSYPPENQSELQLQEMSSRMGQLNIDIPTTTTTNTTTARDGYGGTLSSNAGSTVEEQDQDLQDNDGDGDVDQHDQHDQEPPPPPHQFRTPEDLSSSPIFFKDHSVQKEEEQQQQQQLGQFDVGDDSGREQEGSTWNVSPSSTHSDSQSTEHHDNDLNDEDTNTEFSIEDEDEFDDEDLEEQLRAVQMEYWIDHDEDDDDIDDDEEDEEDESDVSPAYPNYEWMHQSLSTLLAGYRIHPIPILSKEQVETNHVRQHQTIKQDMMPTPVPQCQPPLEVEEREAQSVWEHISSSSRTKINESSASLSSPSIPIVMGPSVLSSIVARESTGILLGGGMDIRNHIPPIKRLNQMSNMGLSKVVQDMYNEITLLEYNIAGSDWEEVTSQIEDLTRLIGNTDNSGADTNHHSSSGMDSSHNNNANNVLPRRPPATSSFYAGEGIVALERDAFVSCGGVKLLLQIIREPDFIGDDSLLVGNDARALEETLVKVRLADNWKAVLALIKELIYYIPELVEDGSELMEEGKFLPLLFTMLAHDCLFDSVVVLIEDILTYQSQGATRSDIDGKIHIVPLESVPAPFSLESVPNAQDLWRSFNCKQLAQFTRIIALLVYEADARGESKSVGLIQCRRDRDVKQNRDTIVFRNQSLLLDDEELMSKLVKLLGIINFAPELSKRSPHFFDVSHVPIVHVVQLLGFKEVSCWKEIDRWVELANQLNGNNKDTHLGNGDATEDVTEDDLYEKDEFSGFRVKSTPRKMGTLNVFLDDLTEYRAQLDDSSTDGQDQGGDARLGFIVYALNAANRAGLIINRARQSRFTTPGSSRSDVNGDEMDGRGRDNENDKGNMNTPENAANILQFNAMILSPYLLEILFVFSTLISCEKRKFDAQKLLSKLGIIQTLEDMFHLLSWRSDTSSQSVSGIRAEDEVSTTHGSGCDCVSGIQLRIQYLRLIHNFCDKECNDYFGRRELLSESEKNFVLTGCIPNEDLKLRPGLLSNIISTLLKQSEDSPYRFWLSSCLESWLRGSSEYEQTYCAKSGLIGFLVEYVLDSKLHCAGSLQTAFDLLGELCKGNIVTLEMILQDMDEELFERLMRVAISNLVDSNVFIRALLLTTERIRASAVMTNSNEDAGFEDTLPYSAKGSALYSKRNISHSSKDEYDTPNKQTEVRGEPDENKRSVYYFWFHVLTSTENKSLFGITAPLSLSQIGWKFRPEQSNTQVVSPLNDTSVHKPNTTARLAWFLIENQTLFFRDLLGVVDLRNINHENICCLNTAILLSIFAHRRGQLNGLIGNLRRNAPNSNSVLVNFRQLLWFWKEYYSHRAKDRISLEFSSHLPFSEWWHVVQYLSSDKSGVTSDATRLPKSPYKRAPLTCEHVFRKI